jgi:hypothetical protein
VTDLPPPPQRPPSDEDVDALVGELQAASPDRVATLLRGLQAAIWAVCVPAAITGAVALLLGLRAWGGTAAGAAIVVLASIPLIAIAAYVGMRAARLADAVTHPGEVLAQARDLVVRAKDSPELRQVARLVRGRGGRRGRGPRSSAGRVRSFVSKGRLVSSVIGLADPDPVEHRLLLPFTPERLRNLWLAVLAGLWWWLAASVVAVFGFVALVARALGA